MYVSRKFGWNLQVSRLGEDHLIATLANMLIVILDQYPILEPDDITASIKFAADLMSQNYKIKQG